MMEMKIYKIEIKETLSRTIEIEAASMDEAFLVVKEMYQSEEIMLGAEDHISTDFIELEDEG
jgi:hypothetical protein